ncbi:hypothetical protein CROQUDRAFT_653936 [Cronartium quercuum f. sp. fusiforme G11]|uniref:Glycerol-3-phosphate dehydrogenase n=1 Tax=Cronartium quercuum f. sp. fusiforme G11 TaxID=708437 RepID=A0A9P6TEW1_9BASI|nr:hypothetical protein CROQUDRAFT_653936 [Cronartium quercuum f. sp. fusiforme G11]
MLSPRLSRFRPRLVPTSLLTLTVSASALYLVHRERERSKLLQLDSGRDSTHPANRRVPVLWTPPNRQEILSALKGSRLVHSAPQDNAEEYDLLVIGGGATGAGVALDAASRGLKVALVERDDFSSGTSSKSTKLVHGGVRYLQKAVFGLDYEQYKLVREALHERKTFLHIAPHLSLHLPIMLPIYKWWQVPYYYAGCKMYDLLAGSENMETSYLVGKGKALENFPMLKSDGLCGAVVYYDGSHNDSRMNMALIMSAVHQGAVVANHMEVVELHKVPERADVKPSGSRDSPGVLCGARVRDQVTGEEFNVRAKGIINATGPFCDGIRKLDDPKIENIVAPSSGVHITLPSYYAPSHMGLIDPETSDGRVIFFLPWQGNAIAGTTDSPAPVQQDPLPKEEEIQWVLGEVRNYLSPELKVRRGDVLSAWCGLRPLVRNPAAKDSQSLVRNHMINVSPSGLLTIAGGKWTTYRAMAEETVDAAIETFKLSPTGPCITTHLQLIGAHGWHKTLYIKLIQDFGLESEVAKHLTDNYGDRAWSVCALAEPTGNRWPVHGKRLDPSYPYLEEEVRYAVRNEYAITPIDILARRTRLSFLNAQAALEVLPRVIDIMAEELGWTHIQKENSFERSRDFMLSMGLPRSKTWLSLSDVRRGLLKKQSQDEGQIFSRAMFTPKELIQLRKEFAETDLNGDGTITSDEMTKALKRLNFGHLSKGTVETIVEEAQLNQPGPIDFSDFLEIASAAKEVSLSKTLQKLLSADRSADDPTNDRIGPFAKQSSGNASEQTQEAVWSRTIPVERSGGGT